MLLCASLLPSATGLAFLLPSPYPKSSLLRCSLQLSSHLPACFSATPPPPPPPQLSGPAPKRQHPSSLACAAGQPSSFDPLVHPLCAPPNSLPKAAISGPGGPPAPPVEPDRRKY
eukprot:1140233-Pelagomonas_calceolata.AAC.8